MRATVTVACETAKGRRLLAPIGTPTPFETPLGFQVDGALFALTGEANTGQLAAIITPDGESVTLTYETTGPGSAYPEELFVRRANRFTRAADALVADARRIAGDAGDGNAAIAALANDVALKFTYGHPEQRFNDGTDEVPFLGCGLAEGSCVDINTYLIAALRAAGFEAGYVTGYFFPAEKHGRCDDMHCWVVSRHAGVIQEWDIAHHLKLGTREIRPGLNPKPGERFAVAHSMGLDFPALGVREMKLLAEPVWVDGSGTTEPADVTIRMDVSEEIATTDKL